MTTLGPLVRVRAVETLADFRVRLGFADSTQKEVDLEPYLRGSLFAAMRADPAAFRAVRVVGSSIGWENGADIDPDVLYYGLTPTWAETGAEVAPRS